MIIKFFDQLINKIHENLCSLNIDETTVFPHF